MCGICGIVSSEPVIDEEPVLRMQNAMVHRGPDGSGSFFDSHIALAMRRLSIIDVKGGQQPLFNEDRSLVLIANGEIYNYIEIRKQLQNRGHIFNTNSDCEVILHLYEDYGNACVHHLRGMFAFAIWDTKKNELILARDRIGEKPLYLYETRNSLIFASELKSLLHSGAIPFILDPDAINLYFYYQYVPEPRTPIKDIRKLEAGNICCINVNEWTISQNCYWKMENAPALTGDPAFLIRRELDEISKQITRSDVPVGIALSGGLDSAAIAALVAKEYPETISAFTIGYPGKISCDERRDAKDLADHLGMPFHDVELTTEDIIRDFPHMNYWRDDPIADISGYGYYAVMKLARQHGVPVMLQGHGGDELFWGYSWVQQAAKESIRKYDYLMKDYEKISSQHIKKALCPTSRTFLNAFQIKKHNPPNQLIFMEKAPDFLKTDKQIKNILSPDFYQLIDKTGPYRVFTIPQPWKDIDIQITRLIIQTYLLENGIAQGDRLGMASSVELRLPLLDHRLVEVVIGLRKNYPDYNLAPKTWFKKAVKDLLPPSVLKRPKRGFTPPVREWHSALFDAYGPILNDGILIQKGVLTKKVASEFAKGSINIGEMVPLSFKALVLEIWSQQMSEILEN